MAAYMMQASLYVTDLEMQTIKLDESAEQLKKATEVTLSRKSCAICSYSGSLKCLFQYVSSSFACA